MENPPPSDPADIELTDLHGSVLKFGELAADPLVVVLVRYYGCLPCQAFLKDLNRELNRFPVRANVVAIGGSADFQAQWLRRKKHIKLPLFLDPQQHVRQVAELGNLSIQQMLSPTGAFNYLKAMGRGFRPQRITRDTVRSPGVAIFGPDLKVQWTHEGKFFGDYPEIDDIVRYVWNN